MNLIVAVDSNWGIGKNNDLLISIPEDMKFFRETTKGTAVLMGRKTLESFPNGNPLKNRVNIVLSRNKIDKEVIQVSSIEEALEVANTYDTVFVIGGGSIYKEFLPYCKTAYVTKIHHSFDADTFFPNLDVLEDWSCVETSEMKEYEGTKYQFCKYEK